MRFEYSHGEAQLDGMLAELPAKLSVCVDFDNVALQGVPTSKRFTLWFRSGAKGVFHIRLLRKTGRCLVEVGGIEPWRVMKGAAVCRDHFDAWFGISPTDIKTYERRK